MYYGLAGLKDQFRNEWSNLMDYVHIECDGKDYTEKFKKYGAHAILFSNIKVSVVRQQ